MVLARQGDKGIDGETQQGVIDSIIGQGNGVGCTLSQKFSIVSARASSHLNEGNGFPEEDRAIGTLIALHFSYSEKRLSEICN